MIETTRANHFLDWMTLVEDTDLAYGWLKSLLTTGTAEITLQPRFDQEKKLWHFFNEQRSAQRLEGRQVLYFTYPYLLRKEAGQLSRTPVLRWPCVLEPPVNNRPHWVLKTYAGARGEANGKVIAALNNASRDNDWQLLLNAALNPSTEALQELGMFAQELAEKTDYCSSSWQPALAQMPQVEIDTAGEGELWWSARLALDTTHWRKTDELPVHFHEPFTHEESAIGNLSLSRLAPAQYHFLKQVFGQRYALAEGNPESGLSSISAELFKLALAQVVRESGREPQLALISAHPELAGKAMLSKTLTAGANGSVAMMMANTAATGTHRIATSLIPPSSSYQQRPRRQHQ